MRLLLEEITNRLISGTKIDLDGLYFRAQMLYRHMSLLELSSQNNGGLHEQMECLVNILHHLSQQEQNAQYRASSETSNAAGRPRYRIPREQIE